MKIGILGYGYMGTIRHRVLRERGDCEVVAIFHTEPGAPHHRPTWQEVVDDPAIDAVFVCLPNDLTTEATCRALASGKHVFAEKPPGRTLDEARRMHDAATASARTLQFGFNLREHPSFRALRALLASGELGALRWMRGVYGKPMAADFASGWRADPARAGGGILLDQGVHLLDLMLVLGGAPARLDAVGATRPPARVEDEVALVMEMPGHVVAMLHSSHTQSPPRFALELGLARGVASMEGLLTRTMRYGPERLGWTRDDGSPRVEHTYDVDDSWAREIAAFVTAAQGGRAPENGSSADSVRLMEVVERVYRSIRG